jgi:hypothetical protein
MDALRARIGAETKPAAAFAAAGADGRRDAEAKACGEIEDSRSPSRAFASMKRAGLRPRLRGPPRDVTKRTDVLSSARRLAAGRGRPAANALRSIVGRNEAQFLNGSARPCRR